MAIMGAVQNRGTAAIRVLITADIARDGLWWVAQCLEYDLAVQARSPKDAQAEFLRLLEARHAIATKRGLGDPLAGIGPAPERFEKAWADSLGLEESSPAEHACLPMTGPTWRLDSQTA